MGFFSDVLSIATETIKITDETLGFMTEPINDIVKDIRK